MTPQTVALPAAPRFHSYDPTTGAFLASASADLDWHAFQMSGIGRWVLPAFATWVAPPAPEAGRIACYLDESGTVPSLVPSDPGDGRWVLLPDHRGEVWYGGGDGRTPVVIHAPGDPALMGLTRDPRPDPEETKRALVAAWAVELSKRSTLIVKAIGARLADGAAEGPPPDDWLSARAALQDAFRLYQMLELGGAIDPDALPALPDVPKDLATNDLATNDLAPKDLAP